MNFRKKIAACLLVVLVAGALLSGCGAGSSTGDEKVLNFGCTNFSDSLDPSTMTNAAWCVSRYSIGEGLYRFDEEMNAQPYLAEKYTVDDSNRVWTFKIKDGIKFSNGKDVTATAVADSIQYMYDQEKSGKGNSTPSVYMQIESMTADDDSNEVKIVTAKPYADLCAVLAHPYFSILDVKAGTDLSNEPIGTGPYAIEKYDAGVSIAMTANPYYWNGTVPYDKVNVIFIDDSSTKAMALQSGDVDVVENIVTSSDLDKLRKSKDFNVSETIGMRIGFSYMNQKGVLADDSLRKAVLLALDDETMCDVTVGGMYTAGASVLPSTLDYGYDQLTDATPYDVDAAKKLLDDAGIVDTDGDGYRELNGKNINLNYLTYDSRNLTDFAEAVATQLDVVGIKATVKTTDADTEWNLLVAGEYDLLATNWMTVPVGDPYSYLDNWYSKSTANYCGYENAEYDRLYEQLEKEMDLSGRIELIKQLQQILIDDSAALVHGYYHSNMCSSTAVTGANINTADYYWITTAMKPAK
ncbi:ABC transporter substrate-binding protein [Aminipila butyrica]|uniref:ABC transporter substrate-binding protein n=1 Tax=Aminipila butyrica TaxID=433296 RepID=A0A858BS32_9FIRM|nr:ABC transporter substrate-binding protein [Aminipila butyrica]QIB68009.1 ABC transporter substrate-binding protein [Aminipila butyrica]